MKQLKTTLSILFLIIFIGCNKINKKIPSTDLLYFDDSVFYSNINNDTVLLKKANHPNDIFISYLDSIKAYDSTFLFPHFLKDPLLDVKHGQVSCSTPKKLDSRLR